MSRLALPYRSPATSCVRAEPWRLVLDGATTELPESLDFWDYRMDVELSRTVHVDLSAARAGAGLPDDAVLTLAAVWTASGSNLRGPVQRVPLTGDGVRTVELHAVLPGAQLGGVLSLETVLVLSRTAGTAAPFAPRRAGSLLWDDIAALRLQGDAPLFPMTVIDFSHTSFRDGAAWHLQLGSDLDAAAMGSMLLLVNEKAEEVSTAFARAARPGPVDRVVLSMVYSDCARIMVEHALLKEEFVDDADFPEDSLGTTLVNLFHRLFPGRTIQDLRQLRQNSPSLFASELQAATRILQEA
ncbi:hypothetical protein [Streptomyces silaceus]|uniref:hypothetical protein n=1 Tax=Streptomyces silaceus TaxID=545123 RepID=UPI000AAA90D2|nr:hypothetical protein [Streptomyces silaceus]